MILVALVAAGLAEEYDTVTWKEVIPSTVDVAADNELHSKPLLWSG